MEQVLAHLDAAAKLALFQASHASGALVVAHASAVRLQLPSSTSSTMRLLASLPLSQANSMYLVATSKTHLALLASIYAMLNGRPVELEIRVSTGQFAGPASP
jgi:hypothetical protein